MLHFMLIAVDKMADIVQARAFHGVYVSVLRDQACH